ncbi:MAG: metallophosphoesterase [Gammaproteobacteria bacterium]|nr:metallophosphoesterase [Gammaproteobacteria bacterium]
MKIIFIASIVLFIGTSNVFSQDWKFVAYGDTRNDNPEHREVMHSMLTNTPDAKFIISSGDVVDNGDVLSQWEDWYTSVTSVFGTTGQNQSPPFYMASPGNHGATETTLGLANWNNFLSGQKEQFCDGKFVFSEGKYFVFDYENVRFVVLDSDKSTVTGEQLTMLMDAIQNNPKQWLIAVWHHPIFDFGEKAYEDEFHEAWGIPLYQNGADLIFNGHSHYYVRTKKLNLNGEMNPPIDLNNGIPQIVVGNGGATMDVPVPDHDNNGYMVESYTTTNSQFGYSELHFKGDSLFYSHILRDGTVFDEEIYTPNFKAGYTGIHDVDALPTEYAVSQNYPNPIKSSTVIQFEVPKEANLNLEIYDFLGRKIDVLIDNKSFGAGTHSVVWEGLNYKGEEVSNGMYFYKLSTMDFTKSLNMIVLK